jgi:hypothetical protein
MVSIEKKNRLSNTYVESSSRLTKDSLVADVVKFEYSKSNKSRYFQEDIEFLMKNRDTLNDWNQLSEEEKDKDGYPRMLRKIIDNACQQVFGMYFCCLNAC